MKVLIVDDTPANLRLLRAVLEGENFEVVEAADGVQAMAVLEGEPIDAVISDILMPNMDGYRFCHEVRRHERLHHLPLIIYSSTYNSPADAKLALDMGADRYIKKPAPIKEITEALAEIIRRGPRNRPEPLLPQRELNLAKLYNESLVNKLEEKNQELSAQTEALRASEEKFRQMTENISECCWIAAADLSEVLYASPAYEKILGRSCQSLYEAPLSFMEGLAEADRVRVMAAVAEVRQGGKCELEHQVLRPDGELRWVRVRGGGIRDSSGVIYRIVGIVEDITRRKSTEEQLRQAQKMEAIGQLAGGVAHDFNNLLTIIGANLELLLMTDNSLPAQSREYLNDIDKATKRAAALTRQLLRFSRSDAMHTQVMDLNELITAFTKMIRRIVGGAICLRNELFPALPLIEADAGMIEQILMNLAVNARDAMPVGGQLIIGTELQEIDQAQAEADFGMRPGRFGCIIVRDTGTGIASENLSRIFDPFFTTKGPGKGTGLGLATVFAIAEQHGGWVNVSSQVGVGTTFRVFLPVTEEKRPFSCQGVAEAARQNLDAHEDTNR